MHYPQPVNRIRCFAKTNKWNNRDLNYQSEKASGNTSQILKNLVTGKLHPYFDYYFISTKTLILVCLFMEQ